MIRSVHIFFIAAWYALAFGTGSATPQYVETGECGVEQVCSYFYSAQQDYTNSGDRQRTSVNATVEITCTSSGIYNKSSAKLYCMVLKQPTIFTSAMENSTEREKRAIQQSVNGQLGNWFCFVQSYSGKIPAVYHPQSEPDHVISLKKSIAAAFQANFEGTEEEEEVDPQSRHKSHYTYTPTDEEGVLKMQRKIRKVDVSEYSTEEPSEDIDTAQDEEVQYRSGRLERSSGNTTVHLVNSSNSDIDSISLSQAFAASGSYSMVLETCRRVGKYTYGVQKRRILSAMGQTSKEEDLKATINKKKTANAEMSRMREKLPSGSVLAALQNYDAFGDKLIPILQSLMELESQYGVLASHTSVMDDIMTFTLNLPDSESDRRVREAVLMLLSTEGSLRSQMALLRAYDNAMDDDESNVILTHISFMKTVRIGFVIGMEERLARSSEDTFFAHQLLLVFSSLATKGTDEVEDRVMNVLSAQATSLSSQPQPDFSDVDIMLRALGNTGSKLSIPLIFSFLDLDTDDYTKIKVAVIEALGKVTSDLGVLTRLEDLLLEDSSDEECAAAIVETLQIGFDHTKTMQQDIVQYSSQIRSHTLLYSLAEAVSFSNNTDLHSMLAEYLKKVDADDVIFDLIYNENSPLGGRAKRGTTNWGDGGNSDYNYVDSLVNRQTHVNTYNRHNAYIDSKTIGINEANVKIAYGYFAGTNTHCDRMKTFGRCIVVGSLLSRTVTLADVKFDVEASTTSASVVAFVRIGTNTLLDYRYQRSLPNHCYLYTRPIARYSRVIFTLRYNIFVYVGYLTLSVDLAVHFNLDVNANVCIGRTGTEVTGALGAITPTAGVTLSGGVTGNLLELARGGVSVSATFNYRLEPAASIQGCTAYCTLSSRICLGIYDSQPDSSLNLDTWYELRSIGWCGWVPCIQWGGRNRVDELSFSWSLGSQARRALWQRCLGNLHPTCAAGALTSPLFSY